MARRAHPQGSTLTVAVVSLNFATAVTTEETAIVIHVRGEIDIATCQRLRDAIEPHLGPGQTIVLDLSHVEFMDSSSLHILIQARERLAREGGSLALRNPSTAATRLLTVTRAEDLLEAAAGQPPPDRPAGPVLVVDQRPDGRL